MTAELDPILDCWYHHLDKGQEFFVVAIDQEKELIEIQYFDGNLEEIDFSEWYEMDLETAEAPEDWAGPLDVAEPDDFGTSVTDTAPDDWDSGSRDNYSRSDGAQAPPGEEQDDWTEDITQEEPWEEAR